MAYSKRPVVLTSKLLEIDKMGWVAVNLIYSRNIRIFLGGIFWLRSIFNTIFKGFGIRSHVRYGSGFRKVIQIDQIRTLTGAQLCGRDR